jgi:outer membrane immunogenic protein
MVNAGIKGSYGFILGVHAMKKILIATVAAVAMTSGAASAADMAMPVKAPIAPAPVYTWTGCYLDAGGGYGMTNLSHNGETVPGLVPVTPEDTAGGRGYYGTAGAGCDYQFPVGGFGNFVVGVLGGYDFMSLKGAFESAFSAATAYEKETGSWDVGGRIGYLVTPNFLTYVSGGYTQARFSAINGFSAPAVAGSALPGNTYHGWFLGGGAETSLSPWLPTGFFLRSDYKFSTYNSADLGYTVAGVPNGFGEHINPYVQQIGTELIYRFNFH